LIVALASVGCGDGGHDGVEGRVYPFL